MSSAIAVMATGPRWKHLHRAGTRRSCQTCRAHRMSAVGFSGSTLNPLPSLGPHQQHRDLQTMRRVPSALRNRTLRQTLKLFLPASGAITVVLLPMALLYKQSQHQAVLARLAALEAAASLQVQQILAEVKGDTSLTASLSSAVQSAEQRQQLNALLTAQLQAYPRYSAIQVFGRTGEPLLQVQRNRAPVSPASLREAVRRGLRLKPDQIWLSPLFWSRHSPAAGLPPAAPSLLAVRPLFRGEQRRGVLVFVTDLERLVRDFDLATNANPELERGYLLSARGQVINPAAGGPALSFATRYPAVWQQLQRQRKGTVEDHAGLFLFNASHPLQDLTVVIQASPHALQDSSAFRQPLGLVVLALLYLLVAAISAAVASAQERLEALRQQERLQAMRLQAVLRSAGMGMGLCDPANGSFRTVNTAVCVLLGRREAELLGVSWWEFCHPDDRSSAQALMQPLLEGAGELQRRRLRFQRPDGNSVWADLALAGTRGSDGSPETLIVQIADVSELVAQAAYLEAAAEAGIVGVWDWDIPRNVLTWDAVMYKLYGRRRDEFAGAYEAWASAVHPEDRAYVEAEIQAAIKGWRPYAPRFRVIWPDGSIRHLQARSRTTHAADGRALRMIGVNYDITDQVQREQDIEQQRALLAATLNALVDPQLFLTLTPELRIAEVNPAAASCLGRSGNQLIGRPLAELLPRETNGALLAELAAVAEQGDPLIRDECALDLATAAEPLYVDLRAVAVRNGVALSFRDITERRRANQLLAASEERFRLLAGNVTDVVFLQEAGQIAWIAPGISSALGWVPGEWTGQRMETFCHPDDQARLLSQLQQVEQGQRAIIRVRIRDSVQRWRWLEIHAGPYRNAAGEQQGVVGAMRVVDEEVAAEAELDRRARTDVLTGLLNRQEILEQLGRLNLRHRRHGDGLIAVLFCDIDHFKEINDRYGHSGGDTVLQTLAARLQHSVRSQDLVGRVGGDELLVVLRAVPSLADAEAIAAKIHRTVREPLVLATGTVQPTLSIGVTLIQPEETIDAVVVRADQAMYEAKRHGRDRVIAFA